MEIWGFTRSRLVTWNNLFHFWLVFSPDKIDISRETCGNYYMEIGLKGLNNHDLMGF